MTPVKIVPVILWMIGSLFSFSALAVTIRELAGTLSIFEVLSIRSAVGLLILLSIGACRPALLRGVTRKQAGMHLLRNGIHYAAQYGWATGLTLLPLAMVFSLEFTTPAWTALLAVPFLGERLTPSRIGVIVFGFAGVLVIVRPGLEGFQPAALLVLLTAVGLGVVSVLTKQLTKTESPFAIVFWMMLVQLPLGLLGSDPTAVTRLGGSDILPILGLGVAGLSSHYCLSSAFRCGDAVVVAPLDFLRIPLIALVGWGFYHEALDIYVFAGAGLIIVGILWNLGDEARPPRPSRPGGTTRL